MECNSIHWPVHNQSNMNATIGNQVLSRSCRDRAEALREGEGDRDKDGLAEGKACVAGNHWTLPQQGAF